MAGGPVLGLPVRDHSAVLRGVCLPRAPAGPKSLGAEPLPVFECRALLCAGRVPAGILQAGQVGGVDAGTLSAAVDLLGPSSGCGHKVASLQLAGILGPSRTHATGLESLGGLLRGLGWAVGAGVGL